MVSHDQAGEQKKGSPGTVAACAIGAGAWWFISSVPSTAGWALAGILLVCICTGYCTLAILLPDPDSDAKQETFVPLPQAETARVKSLPR